MGLTIRSADGVVIGNYIWLSNVNVNSLYRIDALTKSIEHVNCFPEESCSAWFMHKRCFAYGNRIVFIPSMTRHIVVYNIDSGVFTRIAIENDRQGEATLCAEQIGRYVYLFPWNEKCTPIRFDMEKLEIQLISGFDVQIDKYVEHSNPDKFYRSCAHDGEIFFPLCGSDLIARWNPENGEFKTYHTGMDRVINVYVNGQKCFFTLREKYGLGTLDLSTEKVEFVKCDRPVLTDKNLYCALFPFEDMIIAAPGMGSYIHGFKDGKLVFEHPMDEKLGEVNKFYRYVYVGEDVWILPIGIDEIYVIKKDRSIEKISTLPDEKAKEEYEGRVIKEQIDNSFIVENKEIDLRIFLSYAKKE